MAIVFQNKILPNACKLIGFSWLINHFNLNVPLRNLSCISDKRLASQRVQKGQWMLFDAQFNIDNRAFSHLEFSIKHEEIDLLILKYILKTFPKKELTQNIQSNPK
ncbi:MAG: hypothetical protein K0U38_08730, partial [Epsilonproteobacteria bacterium]|nr:hypothetical protein [Campylobacterota bacterium]